MTPSVLFVCLGNICRSPTGEGVLRALASERGLADAIRIDSAGTIAYHAGKRADSRMREAAARRGIELTSRARKIERRDLHDFDLVLAMDGENRRDILALEASPSAELAMLSDFLDDEWPRDVPDPYYGGADGFEYVLDMIQAASPAILERLVPRGR